MSFELVHSDAYEWLSREVADNSIDSMVTDPPAGVEFMGQAWDTFKAGRRSNGWACGGKTGNDKFGGFATKLRPAFCSQTQANRDEFIRCMTQVFAEIRRVLKPGGHGFVWALPRTSHWTATALEDAGLEVRDVCHHLFGTGFPKSHNFDGKGSALKPGAEHWILIRKPLAEPSIERNFARWGTGCLWIDACRIDRDAADVPGWHRTGADGSEGFLGSDTFRIRPLSPEEVQARNAGKGRWPANLILSGDAVDVVDQQGGESRSRPTLRRNRAEAHNRTISMGKSSRDWISGGHDDFGGPSRFFYCPKPTKKEREWGCEALEEGALHRVNPGGLENDPRWAPVVRKNDHPTVKAVALMRWLCRLVTPLGGEIVDPFCGSGSTGVAAQFEGMRFLGIEQDLHFYSLAHARISAAARLVDDVR